MFNKKNPMSLQKMEEAEAVLCEEEDKEEPPVDLSEVITRVEQMTDYGSEARQLAAKFGLGVMSVAWEDNARSKNSCWGPCISDMTLNVQDRALPLVRHPNFEDVTWFANPFAFSLMHCFPRPHIGVTIVWYRRDVPMGMIPLVVGNETKEEKLKTVTLKEYLQNFRQYLTNPQSWAGSE